MEWSERMNAAVDYIEENLTGKIDLNEAANRAYCSVYHFYRIFSGMSGMTPAEYNRQRRLTLAAAELLSGTEKVIDIATKYGYDSPSAFAKAFRNQHGTTPKEARECGMPPIEYPRISFPFEIRGGTDMDYRIIEKPAFELVGRSTKFGVANGEFNKKGKTYWRKYVHTQEYRNLCDLTGGRCGEIAEAPIMTAYLENEDGNWDPVVNVFGVEKTGKMDTKDFEIVKIPAATYVEFNCTMNTSVETNARIYGEWFPSTGYEHAGKPDIAAFFPMPWNPVVYVRWWIPVVKKK